MTELVGPLRARLGLTPKWALLPLPAGATPRGLPRRPLRGPQRRPDHVRSPGRGERQARRQLGPLRLERTPRDVLAQTLEARMTHRDSRAAGRDRRRGAGRRTARGKPNHPVARTDDATRTQNGHIRNDTRDIPRRISSVPTRPICRRNCVASDRACTRVTPQNFHGKEGVDGSSPSEGLVEVPGNRHFVVVYLTNTKTHSGHIWGTRDARRRLASSADTPGTRLVDTLIGKLSAKRQLLLPRLAGS